MPGRRSRTCSVGAVNVLKFVFTGLLAGLVNGLLGVGGGTVLVPALTLWHGIDDHDAHGTTLATILPTAVASTLIYARKGFLDPGLALRIAIGGAVGGFIGARLLRLLPEPTLRKVFSWFLIAAGLQLLIWRGK